MIKLERQDYGKAAESLRQLKINTLFADSVLRGDADGEVYADRTGEPGAFYVAHPYGMTLLYGQTEDAHFHGELAKRLTNADGRRTKVEWLQADPAGNWNKEIESVVEAHNRSLAGAGESGGGQNRAILLNTRINFRFQPEAYAEAKKRNQQNSGDVVRTTGEMFRQQPGAVVPRFFWRNEEQFLAEGVGFSAVSNGKLAATAFSAYQNEHQLEIGIETAEDFRGQGYAFAVCSALIDFCLQEGLEPVWSCRLENNASYRLAQKLGFAPSLTLPYYGLPV